MCSSAVCTVLPCGSSTAFLGVTIILAFIVKKSKAVPANGSTAERIMLRQLDPAGEKFFVIGDCCRFAPWVAVVSEQLQKNIFFWAGIGRNYPDLAEITRDEPVFFGRELWTRASRIF